THGERVRGELQRALPRRVPERKLVYRPGRRARKDRALETGLQPGAATLGAGVPEPGRVCPFVGGWLWKRRGPGPLGKRARFPLSHSLDGGGQVSTGVVQQNPNPENVSLSLD